jgi:hypothetical protein
LRNDVASLPGNYKSRLSSSIPLTKEIPLFAGRASRSGQTEPHATLLLQCAKCPRKLSDDPFHRELRCIAFRRTRKSTSYVRFAIFFRCLPGELAATQGVFYRPWVILQFAGLCRAINRMFVFNVDSSNRTEHERGVNFKCGCPNRCVQFVRAWGERKPQRSGHLNRPADSRVRIQQRRL